MPKGVIINCGVGPPEQGTTIHATGLWGRLCGEANKAQALDLCKDGILTGRGLHKFPLLAELCCTALLTIPAVPAFRARRNASDYEPQSASSFP
jgi:hypothetical protein